MTAKQPWFTVDKAGLAKIVAQMGKGPLRATRAALDHPELFA